ncbi:uncharacterized protein LOC117911872 [Vitis riparia]|uniref:uncharacterized protein LOC117911872 n=1 Tax=Vitis riparia TaxID=96939 RepID=UPI00155A1F51|nr:uncharacterized protein LOC117911872 [Vitis riparia]
MKTKGKKQSKAMRCIGAPLRVLAKAGDFYMRSMMDCSGGVGYGGLVGCPALQVSHLPNSFSVSSSKRRDEELRLRELMGRVSKRSGGSRVEMERRKGVGMRSYSIGIGRIGRIDEEKPCEFVEDDDGKLKADVLYPRSRSCAVTKRNAVFY